VTHHQNRRRGKADASQLALGGGLGNSTRSLKSGICLLHHWAIPVEIKEGGGDIISKLQGCRSRLARGEGERGEVALGLEAA
jgi:hypothetical protein